MRLSKCISPKIWPKIYHNNNFVDINPELNLSQAVKQERLEQQKQNKETIEIDLPSEAGSRLSNYFASEKENRVDQLLATLIVGDNLELPCSVHSNFSSRATSVRSLAQAKTLLQCVRGFEDQIPSNIWTFNRDYATSVKIYLVELENKRYPSDKKLLKKYRCVNNFACWYFKTLPQTKFDKFKKKIGIQTQIVEVERKRAKNLPIYSRDKPHPYQRNQSSLDFRHPAYNYREFNRQSQILRKQFSESVIPSIPFTLTNMGNSPVRPGAYDQADGNYDQLADNNIYRQGTTAMNYNTSVYGQGHMTQQKMYDRSQYNTIRQPPIEPSGTVFRSNEVALEEYQNENSHPVASNNGQNQNCREGGNSRPWSQNVYFKLFLDPEGIKASLLVVKCELNYVNLFTNQSHTLYKCRFIGGKNEGENWVFDLMKSQWEPTVPSTDAAEVNYMVTMNFAPSKSTCACLKSLIQLQKSLLRGLNFQGHVKVYLRFSHPTNWRDLETQKALRNLFQSGVNFQVLSAEDILMEMRADGLDDGARQLGEFNANTCQNIYQQQGGAASKGRVLGARDF